MSRDFKVLGFRVYPFRVLKPYSSKTVNPKIKP
jgi:hypothetical protein